MKRKGTLLVTKLLRRITAALLIGTALFLVLNTYLYIRSNSMANTRYLLSHRATQFMNASAYLTSEVRAYATTGDITHYDNYENEVHNSMNREIAVDAMKKLGVTEEEKALIEQMSFISDSLVPLEEYAMALRLQGDVDGAMEIVYGEYYNSEVSRIRALRDEFRVVLDERTERDMNRVKTIYDTVNIITWVFAFSVIVIQFVQKGMLYRLAYIDHMTGGLNYYAFREKMNGIRIRKRDYVVAADLKNFGIINDVCGLEKGDEIICETARIIDGSVKERDGELSAHLSGDRFVLFMQCEDDAALIERLGHLREEIVSITLKTDIPYLFPVFGINEVENTAQPELSYGTAKFANRQLKNSETDGYYLFFDKKMLDTVLGYRRMEDDFDTAVKERRFEVWYQPKYNAADGKCIAAEALVRWRKEDGTLVFPGSFIPRFEHNGMIVRLDEYVFEEVCAKQRKWLDAGMEPKTVSVNISRATVLRPNIVGIYTAILGKYGVPPECIELELTESAMSGGGNVADTLMQFRAAGLHVLVDDFGVGYSSLSTLVYGCFDGIKLDKSIVDKIETEGGERLAEIIIDLAHEFGMKTTAEGVETESQSDKVKDLSCDIIQGYYYSRPLPAAEFEKTAVEV